MTTYQAGQLVSIGTYKGQLDVGFTAIDQPMGLAVSPKGIAIGASNLIWLMRPALEISNSIEPAGRYDASIVTNGCFVTGNIQGHELAWIDDELWGVNTLFSCICKFSSKFSFIPTWRPQFISQLAAEDRCHLNGFAVSDNTLLFATALGESNYAKGWRPDKSVNGIVVDTLTNQVIARGLSMPHSPRFYRGQLWVLDSGRGSVVLLDINHPIATVVTSLPGYCRGLAFSGDYAFVGLSRIRETAVFGGLPIVDSNTELKCGLGAINLVTGKLEATLEFTTGVEEIFDVQIVPQVRNLAVFGPCPDRDSLTPVWIVPEPQA